MHGKFLHHQEARIHGHVFPWLSVQLKSRRLSEHDGTEQIHRTVNNTQETAA